MKDRIEIVSCSVKNYRNWCSGDIYIDREISNDLRSRFETYPVLLFLYANNSYVSCL